MKTLKARKRRALRWTGLAIIPLVLLVTACGGGGKSKGKVNKGNMRRAAPGPI